MIQNLEVVGAFSSVEISQQNVELDCVDCNKSDSDLDNDKDMSDVEDEDDWWLSKVWTATWGNFCKQSYGNCTLDWTWMDVEGMWST